MKNSSAFIEVPEPCRENWNEMKPEEKGRFCDKCCKVVMDFTSMSTGEVVDFISSRSSEKICGRFRSDQVSVPPQFPKENVSVSGKLKIFLAALVFVFGGLLFTGCGTSGTTVGEMIPVTDSAAFKKDNGDTSVFQQTKSPDSISAGIQGQAKCDSSSHAIDVLGEPVYNQYKHEKTMGKPVLLPKDSAQ